MSSTVLLLGAVALLTFFGGAIASNTNRDGIANILFMVGLLLTFIIFTITLLVVL